MTSVFVYVNTEKALLYRAILRVFIESKERFVVRLRSHEVFEGIRRTALHGMTGTRDESEIESALGQLCEWGNLQSLPDTMNVCSVEEFYHPRPIFQLTSHGEAAERALALYHASSEPQVKLPSSVLTDFRCVLQELQLLSRQPEPDAGHLHRNLLLLHALFEELSATTQKFIDQSDRRVDLPQPDARRLIEYGRQLIGELELETTAIAETIREMELAGFERQLQILADRSCRDWHLQWQRFRGWFISQPGLPSNADRLRERARASIPAFLRIISDSHDPRVHRIDRANDFRVLARWFVEAESEAEAHVLWRAAFGLGSARHLTINDATLDDREAHDIPADTSWLDAPPLRLSDYLRDYRGNSRTGGLSRIIDRSAEKAKLAAASQEEAQRLLSAQRRFGTGSRIRLSELEHLEAFEFELFLDLLGEAVSARVSSSEAVEILSGDGCLRVRLEPTGDQRVAWILTTEGMFSGPDQWISMEQTSAHEALEVDT